MRYCEIPTITREFAPLATNPKGHFVDNSLAARDWIPKHSLGIGNFQKYRGFNFRSVEVDSNNTSHHFQQISWSNSLTIPLHEEIRFPNSALA